MTDSIRPAFDLTRTYVHLDAVGGAETEDVGADFSAAWTVKEKSSC